MRIYALNIGFGDEIMNYYGKYYEKSLNKRLSVNFIARITAFLVMVVAFILAIGTKALPGGTPLIVIIVPIFFIFNKISHVVRTSRVNKRTYFIAENLGDDVKALKKEFIKRRFPRDYAWIMETTDSYYKKCEEKKEEFLANPPAQNIENDGIGDFSGGAFARLGMLLACILITAFTFGIGFPVAYVLYQRWIFKNTTYDGRQVIFDGKISNLMLKWIAVIFIFVLFIAIPQILQLGMYAMFFFGAALLVIIVLLPSRLLRWKVSHLHIEGENRILGSSWTGNAVVLDLLYIGTFILGVITPGIMKPVNICWRKSYVQNHMFIDGHNIHFDGDGGQMIGNYILWNLLSIITLGIYALFVKVKIAKWVNKHTHLSKAVRQAPVIKEEKVKKTSSKTAIAQTTTTENASEIQENNGEVKTEQAVIESKEVVASKEETVTVENTTDTINIVGVVTEPTDNADSENN